MSLADRQLLGEAWGALSVKSSLPRVIQSSSSSGRGPAITAQEGRAEARNEGRRARWTRR